MVSDTKPLFCGEVGGEEIDEELCSDAASSIRILSPKPGDMAMATRHEGGRQGGGIAGWAKVRASTRCCYSSVRPAAALSSDDAEQFEVGDQSEAGRLAGWQQAQRPLPDVATCWMGDDEDDARRYCSKARSNKPSDAVIVLSAVECAGLRGFWGAIDGRTGRIDGATVRAARTEAAKRKKVEEKGDGRGVEEDGDVEQRRRWTLGNG